MIRKLIVYTLLSVEIITCAGCGGSFKEKQNTNNSPSFDYENAVVSYLGPEGTYTQEACMNYFKHEGKYIPYVTVTEAVDALVNGDCNYSVIPQENSIGGAVIEYLDVVINEPSVNVVGEIELPINQNLLVVSGTSLENINKVYSHKQGIAQGKAWLEENLPNAEIVEVSSTAEGARIVSENDSNTDAAIASAACADVYKLDILVDGIQQNDLNKTRFYVLTTREPIKSHHDRLAFIATGKSKNLPSLMQDIKEQGMTLVAIHDRPQKTSLGEYNYLIECSDGEFTKYEKISEKNDFEFRYLGSFDVCDSNK